jgi:hypothetical protein
VNGDGFCTPNDVLRIVNFINAGGGEGESSSGYAVVPLFALSGSPLLVPDFRETHDFNVPAARQGRPSTESVLLGPGVSFSSTQLTTVDAAMSDASVRDDACELDRLLDEFIDDVCEALGRTGVRFG